jgi:hypothetical protein
MRAVRRYIWAALFSAVAIGWYCYSELTLNVAAMGGGMQDRFAAEIWGKTITTGVTFGVFFGFVVLLAAEVPERLRGCWSWWACLILSLALGFFSGLILWLGFPALILYNTMLEADQMSGVLIGALGVAAAFAPRAAFRIPAWLATLWAAAAFYLPLYLTWVNFSPPLIYTNMMVEEHINQYAIPIALLFAIGAYVQGLFAEVRQLVRRDQPSEAPA